MRTPPSAISNPLAPTRAQLQKAYPPPDLPVSPSLSITTSSLRPQHTLAFSHIQLNHTHRLFSLFSPISHLSKCLPRPPTRSPPPRPPPLPPRLPRRRTPARRPLLLVTRRSAPRPARRLTLLTSTRVSSNPIRAFSRHVFSKRVKLTCIFSPQAGPP